MNHIDLFSGIGGFAFAASRVWKTHKILSFCEIDPWAKKILAKNFPGVPIHDDIKTFTWKQGEPAGADVDLLTGGFPCQPFSQAGKRAGAQDDRYLWPEMLRVIKESRPRWIVGENVTGIINMELESLCIDLETAGYEVRPLVIPACAIGAPQIRERVWIIANSDGNGLERCYNAQFYPKIKRPSFWAEASRICGNLLWGRENRVPKWWFSRAGAGLPREVDRIRGLGNAIVPQVAQVIFEGIKSIPITK